MQPTQKPEESSAPKTAVLPSAKHSSTKAEVDTTKTKRTQYYRCFHSPLPSVAGHLIYVLEEGNNNSSIEKALICSLGTRIAGIQLPWVHCTKHGVNYRFRKNELCSPNSLCDIQRRRYIFKAYDWRLMVIIRKMLKFDNENGNKTTDFMSRLCKLTPPGTGLLQFNFNETEGNVIAQFQWRYGSWMWEANYDTVDIAQVEKTMRSIISSAEFMSIQSEESAKQLAMDDKSTWSTPEYPWGPFQFGVRRGPGVSKNQRQEMEDERRKFEEAKGVWPITNIQCILLSIIVMFGMAVALAAIDFKDVAPIIEVEEEQPLEGLEMQPKQKSEESSAPKTAVLSSARHSSIKAEVDTTKT